MAPSAKPKNSSGNKPVVRGIGRFSRSKVYHKRGLWAIKAKHGGSFPTHEKAAAPEVKEVRAPKFYPADDVKKPLHKNQVLNTPKLRANIIPGAVLILLAGRFKGKRVVFLKQLEGGLLLITGPFKVNGVPLRRVNQNYVIATSTKLDISSANLTKYTDAYFKREIVKKKKGESEFFEAEKETEEKEVPEEKKDDQKALDALLIPIIEKTSDLRSYLAARFSLKSGVKPHELVF
jgi:large subunit ribosomal protein L6e